MIKNTAGQKIGAQMITAADGTIFTGAVTCYVTGDAGTQALGSVGSGVCTNEGNGYSTYAPSQGETNYSLVAFTFIGTGAISVTVQVFTQIVQQTLDNAAGIADIPTVAEFNARTLVAADYTIVSDLGVVQSADHTAAIAAIPTVMRGTDNAALASVCTETRLAELDPANLPTDIADIPTVSEFNLRSLPSADYTIVADLGVVQSADHAAEIAKIPKSDSTVTWNATALASIKTQVTDGINTALPATPTAASLGDYVKRAKLALCNRWDIVEASGNLEIFNDAGASFTTVAAAFTTLAGVTLRKKIL